ncbi:MAG: hypothetical protein ACRC1K_19790 [Planctomycetia bacterium]
MRSYVNFVAPIVFVCVFPLTVFGGGHFVHPSVKFKQKTKIYGGFPQANVSRGGGNEFFIGGGREFVGGRSESFFETFATNPVVWTEFSRGSSGRNTEFAADVARETARQLETSRPLTPPSSTPKTEPVCSDDLKSMKEDVKKLTIAMDRVETTLGEIKEDTAAIRADLAAIKGAVVEQKEALKAVAGYMTAQAAKQEALKQKAVNDAMFGFYGTLAEKELQKAALETLKKAIND